MIGRRAGTVELVHTEAGDGPPVVLIMGLNAPGSAWAPHADVWSRSLRCLSVDNRGAGASPAPPGPYSTAELADDYADLIERVGLGSCRVVGISMGGAIAQELALRHPGLVQRLVLVASWARADAYTRTVVEVITALRKRADEATFTAHLQSLVWTPAWFAAQDDELRAARSDPLAVTTPALAAQAAACTSHDAVGRLGALRVPTLVTAGRADRFVPFESSQALAEAIPASRFEAFSTGHVHHWEELDRFNTLVEEFLHG